MDTRYSNSFQFNIRRYEGHLSLFGRKVLGTLIKKWTSDRNRSQNQHSSYQSRMPPPGPPASYCPARSKKVLTFLSEHSRSPQIPLPPPIECIKTPNENNKIDEPFDYQGIENYLLPVPTTNELFKTVQEPSSDRRVVKYTSNRNERIDETTKTHKSVIDEVNVSTYDMINPVKEGNETKNITYDLHNKLGGNNPIVAHIDDKLKSISGLRVNWDDMFDTELIPIATNAKLMIQQNATATTNENTFKIALPEDADGKEQKSNVSKISKTKENKQNDVKKTKRKTQTKVTDAIPKKVKKTVEQEMPKINFRKQKYTKTVKNWLDNVNPDNPVNEEEITRKADFIAEDVNKRALQIVFEKNKDKNNKKVVQAQLANKDGKMKFGKPKEKLVTEAATTKTDCDKSEKTKEKKTKPKFLAPIKSQVPIKEVEYEVVSVDNANTRECTESLQSTENKDLIIVIVYCNGFTQLNQQHTEELCEPEGFIVKIEAKFYYFKGFHLSFKKIITKMLEKNRIVCYEGKSLLIYLKSKFDLEFNDSSVIDTKIGGSLLDPDNPPENFSDLQKLLSYSPQYTIATDCSQQKAAWYATLLDECAVKLTTALKEDGLWRVFVDIEMKLLPIIAEMERRGVTVALQKLKSMEDVLLTKMKEVEQECYKAAGRTFQINSAVQIRTIIYDELQLDTKCNVKIKETICKGAKSTSETMLRSLVSVHPLPRLILEYRHLHKVHATFLTGIAQQVKDGIVRPTWVQTAAVTGRIASNNPNLQAIPKAPFSLILFPDENNSGNQSLSIRSVYTSRAGHTLVAADFKHVECRVFAHCAADTSLTHALHAGDLFRALAAKWLNKPEAEISSEDRERTKRIVYAGLYGAGCRKLMDILGVSYEQALSIITSFNRTFPSLKSFGRSVVSRCEQNGGRLSTLCGRGRRFKNITSQDFQLKAQAERQAVNYIVQGSAADLCKMAMVRTSQRLRSHSPPVDGYLLLQIHDELVWEIRDEHVDAAAAIIKEVMESCGLLCGMSMSLPVALSVGHTWGGMAEYTTPTFK